MKFRVLNEAEFHGLNHIKQHYGDHVLANGEQFNPANPKFPSSMSLLDYLTEAKELSETVAGTSVDTKSNVVGWEYFDPKNRGTSDRYIKIRRNSKFMNGYSDVVLYTDQFNDDQVFSFMLSPRNVWRRFKNYYVAELPENQTFDDETVTDNQIVKNNDVEDDYDSFEYDGESTYYEDK